MKPISIITISMLLAFEAIAQQPATYQLKPRHKTVVKAQNKTGLITLERSVCFGTCPSYIVTLASDGKVIWEGRDFVKTMGKATAQIRPEGFDKLVKEFEKIKFATLDDKYETTIRDGNSVRAIYDDSDRPRQ